MKKWQVQVGKIHIKCVFLRYFFEKEDLPNLHYHLIKVFE